MRLFKDNVKECRNAKSQVDYDLIITPPTSKACCED